jgi:hypothetical protein
MTWTITPRHEVWKDGARVEQRTWLVALGNDFEARRTLTAALREAPHAAYLWETPPALPGRMAEFALIDSLALTRSRPDPSAFAAKFDGSPVATFGNLGGDSVLIAPDPMLAPGSTHLAAFLRGAPEEIVDALWTAVGVAAQSWLTSKPSPLWVSTSGLAVPWLHVRLDAAPKYYSHVPYRS